MPQADNTALLYFLFKSLKHRGRLCTVYAALFIVVTETIPDGLELHVIVPLFTAGSDGVYVTVSCVVPPTLTVDQKGHHVNAQINYPQNVGFRSNYFGE